MGGIFGRIYRGESRISPRHNRGKVVYRNVGYTGGRVEGSIDVAGIPWAAHRRGWRRAMRPSLLGSLAHSLLMRGVRRFYREAPFDDLWS